VSEQSGKPVLRVVKGNPSDEEVAALLAVVLTRTEPVVERRRSAPGWADRGNRVRRTPRPGPGAWRTSAWR